MVDEHKLIGVFSLSGSKIEVGIYSSVESDSVYFKTEDNADPIYISVPEAELFANALMVAKHRIRNNEV